MTLKPDSIVNGWGIEKKSEVNRQVYTQTQTPYWFWDPGGGGTAGAGGTGGTGAFAVVTLRHSCHLIGH